MNNTILIDSSMSCLYNSSSLKKKAASSSASTGNAYLDILKALTSQESEAAEEISAADMTMDEYKEFIGAKMQKLSKHASRSESTASVIISNAGWEKMKNDPSYESWVLDKVQSNLSEPDPWASLGSSSFATYRFGAEREEYREDSWGKDYPGDVKSYLTSEIFGENSSVSLESLWMKIAMKKQKAANQQAMEELTNQISRLQQLNLLKSKDMTSLKNSTSLLSALNAYNK